MNNLPLHPAIVHIPLGVAFLAPLVMAVLVVAIWKNWFSRKAWAVAILVQAFVVLGGFAAMNTGERDEKPVKKVVPKGTVHDHEENAEAFVWTSAGVLAVSTASFFLPAGPALAAGTLLSTAGAAGGLALAIRTGHSGGELVFKHGAAKAFESGMSAADAPNGAESEHHERD